MDAQTRYIQAKRNLINGTSSFLELSNETTQLRIAHAIPFGRRSGLIKDYGSVSVRSVRYATASSFRDTISHAGV